MGGFEGDGMVKIDVVLHIGSNNVFRSKNLEVVVPPNDLIMVLDFHSVFLQE